MSSLRILIADDQPVVRTGVRAVLAARPEWQVCGETATGQEAVAKALETRPTIAIMDVTMPDSDGLAATRQIRDHLPECEVVIFSVHESNQLIRAAVAAGAKGYVLKTDAAHLLLEAVAAVSRHEPYFSSRANYILTQEPPVVAATLTPREREVVRLVANGKTSKEIAGELGISQVTVETHRANVMRRLAVRTVADLVRYAIREKLIEA